MSLIRIATANLLETASSVTDTGTPVSGYPISRLYDRNVAREYRITEDVARETIITGGVSAISVNALMIAAGHNVGGLTYTLAKSTDGTNWTTVKTGDFAAGTGVICEEFSATTGAHWRLTLPTNQDVTITEMLLTTIYTCTDQADRDSSSLRKQLNVASDETTAGSERWISNGPTRRLRSYSFQNVPEAMANTIETMIDALAGAKPFYLCDHQGAWIWGNLTEPMEPQEVASVSGVFKSFTLEFREVL